MLTPHRHSQSLAHIDLQFNEGPADTLSEQNLESLRLSIPAARCLPLLRQLARREAGTAAIDYLDESRLAFRVEPCV